MKTRFAKVLVLLTLVAAMAAMMAIPASAVTVTDVPGLELTCSNTSEGSISETSSGIITATVKGGSFLAKENTITIMNTSNSRAELVVNYTVSGQSEFKVNGSASTSTAGTLTVVLAAEGTATFYIKASRKATATLTLSDFSLTPVAGSANVTVQYDDSYGSVTADGSAVTSGTTQEVSSSTGVDLVATAKSNCNFLGWINAADCSVLSTDASYKMTPDTDVVVKAVFIGANSKPHFMVGTAESKSSSTGLLGLLSIKYNAVTGCSYIFDDLNAAAAQASKGSAKYIVLMNNATLPAGTYTIPSGVTLVIPFDSQNSVYTSDAVHILEGAYNSTTNYKQPTAYRTLTMADGANLVINGTLSLPAKHRYANGGAANGGSPVGDVSFINMKNGSSITVNNGGALYAYGYIIGDGKVTAKSGANVYEYFQIMDFRGGDQTTKMENGVFPLSQYYVQNIEVPLTLEYGAVEYSYTTVYMSKTYTGTSVAFIGPGDSAMFKTSAGSVTKRYDGATDRLIIEVDGSMSISPIVMDVGGTDLDSSKYVLPVNSNITIKVNSGSISINQDVAILPGARLEICEDATATLANGCKVYFYDADEWGNYVGATPKKLIPITYAPSKTYTRTEADLVDALAIVDGTVDAGEALVYSTTGGANVTSNGGGKVIITKYEDSVTYQLVQGTGYSNIPVTSGKLKNADGSYLETGKSTGTVTYTYDKDLGKWLCDVHTYGEGVKTAPTCTADGYTTYTCTVCGDSKQETTGDPTGHTEVIDKAVAPTCTATGLKEGKHCSVCNAVLTAQEEIEALGHEEVIDAPVAPTCTATGLTEGKHCGRCSQVLTAQTEVSATGHTEVVDAAVEPTCTATGLTEGKHCSVCSAVLTEQTVVSAKGHTAEVDAAVEPTCTATGLTAGSHCSVCNEVLVAQEEIEALGHEEETVAGYAATCTVPGLTDGKKCSQCGEVFEKQEEIPASGHKEVTDAAVAPTLNETGLTEGTHCSVCSQVLTVQQELPALLKEIWQNMTLSGDLVFNLHIEADDSVKVSVTYGKETTEYAAGTVSVKVAAAQMADSITLTVTNPNNAEDKVERVYFVAAYAKRILEDETQKAYHALVQAMLNYGAAAQKYFGYNLDNIVSEMEGSAAIPDSTAEMKAEVTNENVRFYGASLVYRDKIAVRFYFTGNAKDIVFTANGNSYAAQEKDGLWYVEVNDIMPQELDQQITLTADGICVSYGPMNYIIRMNQKGDAKLQALMKELYNYHLAASELGK